MSWGVNYSRFFVLHLFCLSLTALALFIGFTSSNIGVFAPLFIALALYIFALAVLLETLLGLGFLIKWVCTRLGRHAKDWSEFSGRGPL